jgi:hypothetical protein
MRAITKFMAASAVALTVGAIAAPASAAYLIGFATASQDVSPGLQYVQDVSGIGGTVSNVAAEWSFKEVLPNSILNGIDPLAGVSTNFALNATSSGDGYQCVSGVCGVAGFDGSFSYIYTGADQEYNWYGNTRTLLNGANLLSVSFQNAWLQGTGAGSFNVSTVGTVPGVITAISSDVFNFSDSEDFEFSFSLAGGGLVVDNVGPNAGQNFNGFSQNVAASFAAGAIPEPGTWGLMIMGFGGAGAMLRSRRRQAALA